MNERASIADLLLGPVQTRLTSWGQNLFDKRMIQHAADISGMIAGSYNPGRSYRVEASLLC